MKKKEDEKDFQFKDLFINKQYRSILILVFYVVLFAVLIVTIRIPNENTVDESGKTIINLDGYELIDNKNFSYTYTVILDEETYIYEGQKFNNKDLVSIINGDKINNYYIEDENVYIKEEDKYRLALTKPIVIFDFFNTEILKQLIVRGILIDESVNRYKIDNQVLYDILKNDSIKVDSGENYITLNYRNSNITKITFEITNYAKLIGEPYEKIIISLEYYDFNLVEDFKNITVE